MNVRSVAWAARLAILLMLAGCSADESVAPAEPKGFGRAYGIWQPSARETCTKAAHDVFATLGPDGKRYPTWHPPSDPATGCSFGHEHGRDPRGSNLYRQVGDLPFGYANDQLDLVDPQNPRHEDHVGHKVEWENDIRMNVKAFGTRFLDVRCDVLTKLHQGTHSKDAFTNNLHELIYHITCNDGTEMHVTMMAAIGNPGEFTRSCNHEQKIVAGIATPPNSPRGGGRRIIPDKACIEQFMLVSGGRNSDFGQAVHESWQTSNSIRREDGHAIASFDPYYQVRFPSRFYDPALPNVTGRPLDACYLTEGNGDRARGGPCEESTTNGAALGVTWDDPRSAFNGVKRHVDVNGNRVDNADGPAVWYTDPFGRKGRTAPFPGSIRQVVAKMKNVLEPHGASIGSDRFYGGSGVRAPN